MTKRKQGNDPFAAREAAKYESPIPSREFMIDTLRNIAPCHTERLSAALGLNQNDDQQQEALRRRVGAMIRDGQLKQSYDGQLSIIDRDALVAGKIAAHKEGYGFFLPLGGGEDCYLNYHEMRKVFDGDEVLVRVAERNNKGKLEAEIVEVTKRNTERVVGKLLVEGEKLRIAPENPKIQHTIFIDSENGVSAEHEQIVVVEITRQPDARRPPRGIIVSVLGNRNDPGMEIAIALHTFGIPHEWPEAVLEQVKHFGKEPDKKDKQGRIDLRDLPLVTIDGEDAKDFDDAVYCEKKSGGGWRLWVEIADVSHYVAINTPLDHEAELRGTSVYFPDFVVPMLPEELSNGLCSLKPAVDRLCMVCEMTISARGRLTGYQFYEAVMHSHARLTYTEVGRMLQEKDDKDSIIRNHYADLVKHIDELHKLYLALRGQRVIRGAMDFETTETRAIFDENRKIESIVPLVRNDAHKLIEECMLCANVATAQFLMGVNLPVLFRVHEGPTEKKLANLRAFITELGLSLGGGDTPEPRDYQSLSEQIKERPDAVLIQTMMLRSMSQAVYQPENKGHFGLAYEAYAHFTSPIRRYPDLLVHRAIRYAIRNTLLTKHTQLHESVKVSRKKVPYAYDLARMIQLGEHCSMTERSADDATRDAMSSLKCEYLQAHIGSTFSGMITSVAPFGFFVELDELYTEGLVHVSELGGDFYQYDGKQRLIGERTRQVYRIGDRLNVTVARIDLDERKVHLSLNAKGGKKVKADGFRKRVVAAPVKEDADSKKGKVAKKPKLSRKKSVKSASKPAKSSRKPKPRK